MDSTTEVRVNTLADELDKANPNTISDAMRKVKLGTMLTPITATIDLGGNSDNAVDFPLDPPALLVQSFRVTDNGDGNAAEAPRQVVDAGGTPSATVATLAADGSKITVEGTGGVVAIVSYIPRSFTDVTEAFPDK